MIVAIHQPNYIPWIGLFEKIYLSDIFVFYDNVQMPKNKSLVSRNKILSNNKSIWLTVPIEKKGFKSIANAKISDTLWQKKHLNTIHHAYRKHHYYNEVYKELTSIFIDTNYSYIADLNIKIINLILKLLEINKVKIYRASELNLQKEGADSIYEILEMLGAKTYLSGKGAGTERHMDYNKYEKMNIDVKYCITNINHYYPNHKDGDEILSILDLLFDQGAKNIKDKLNNICMK